MGLGYGGLAAAVVFAEPRGTVVGVDVDGPRATALVGGGCDLSPSPVEPA
jgi:UDP-N-acetyl-D-mannosaminuronate dehydrogenase